MFTTEFWLTSLIVVLIPGTGVIYTVSTGLLLGWRASIAAALGCTTGIIPHLTASILGLSAILHMSAVVFHIVKYAGVAYLLYLAWSMWCETAALKVNATLQNTSCRQIIVRGFLINILNPKLSIFFLAFLPLFVSPAASSPPMQMTALSAAFMAMTFGVFVCYGLFSSAVRRYVISSEKVSGRLQKSFAAAFAVLGIKLALTEQ